MQTSILRRSPALTALAALLLAALFVLFAPVAASAHDALIGSDPEAGSTVDELPAELRLTYSAAIIAEGRTAVEVLDPDGTSVTEGEPVVDGAVVTQALGQATVAGEYRVLWQITSSDGHLTSEEFTFTVAGVDEPAPTGEPAPTEEPTAADADETGAADADGTGHADENGQADDAAADAPGEADVNASEDTAFPQALPWIIAGVILIGGGGALVAVLANRAKRRGPEHSDGV